MMAPELIGLIMSLWLLLLFKVKLLLSLSLALLLLQLLLLLFSAVVLLAVFLAPPLARLVFFFGRTKLGSQRTSTGFGQPGISIVLKVGWCTVTGVFRGRGGVFAALALAAAAATAGGTSSTPEEVASVGGTEVSMAVEIGAELEAVFPVVFALPKTAVSGGGSTTTSPLFSPVMEVGGGVIVDVIIVGVVEVSCMMPGG